MFNLPLSENIGNKAANLVFLRDLVDVPEFQAIEHCRVKNYFDQHLTQVNVLWNEFVQIQKDPSASLTSEAKNKLHEIQDIIRQDFKDHPFEMNEIDDLLKKNPNTLFMVRSTGREDDQQHGNPGGNVSIIAVPNDPVKISIAMGEVLASYFSVKSIEQRQLSRDNIFSEPFLPVLIQVMVGVDGVEDTRDLSGVIYTEEPEGKTSDLTLIDVAFGQGHGVVAGVVPHDTYYLGHDGVVHSVVRMKDTRLVPDKEKEATLIKERVPHKIQKEPALSLSLKGRLKEISDKLHHKYGMPMDIEWVYKQKEDKIYIVQARPIISAQETIQPSLIDTAQYESSKVKQGLTIVSAGGEARIISSKDEIIFAPTVAEALDIYLYELSKEEKAKVRAIISQETAPSSSHEAGMFRAASVAVLQLDRKENVQESWDPQSEYLVVDTQQGLIVKDRKKPDMSDSTSSEIADQLKNERFLLEGWLKHPIIGQESIFPLEMDEEEIGRFWKILNPEDEKVKRYAVKPLKVLLEQIAQNKNEKKSAAALSALLLKVYKKSIELKDRDERVALLLPHIFQVAETMTQAKDRMQYLHAVKRIETVLFQMPQANVVQGYSFAQVLEEQKGMKALDVQEKDKFSPMFLSKEKHLTSEQQSLYLVQYRKITPYGLNDEVKKKWEEFTAAIAYSGSPQANAALSQLIVLMTKHNLLSTWLHVSFDQFSPKELKNTNEAIGVLKKLLSEVGSCREIIEKINEKRTVLNEWTNKINDWADPSNYSTLFQGFQSSFIPAVTDLSITSLVMNDETSRLGKLLIFKYLEESVDVFDLTIKSLKNSPIWKENGDIYTQSDRFIELLSPYKELMEHWIRQISDDQIWEWYHENTNAAIPTQETIIKKIDDRCDFWMDRLGRIKQDETDPAQIEFNKEVINRALSMSPSFNVGTATIGSGATLDRVFGQSTKNISLEDLFSLFHQNILACLGTLKKDCDIETKSLDPKIQELMIAIQKMNKNATFSINYTYPTLEVNVNLPLRNHSAGLKIDFNLVNKKMELALDLYLVPLGDARYLMEFLFVTLILDSVLQGVPQEKVPTMNVNKLELKTTWTLSSENFKTENLKKIIQIIDKACQSSNLEFLTFRETPYLNADIFEKMKALPDFFKYCPLEPFMSIFPDAGECVKEIKESKNLFKIF
jgi:hypothetical protein